MSETDEPHEPQPLRLSRAQWVLLFVLAAVQFMHAVDFVIIMPLAPQLEDGLGVGTRQFGYVVSAYGLAAFFAGLLLAPLLDQFDRKRSLLGLFAGFTVGTLMCAVAPDYAWLLAGRAIAGGFGGIAAANVFSIVGDAFPDRRRGMATGVIMSAFSVSSIAGVPAGIMLARAWSWRAPFFALTVGAAACWLLALFAVAPLRGHLAASRPSPAEVLRRLAHVASRPAHLKAFALMGALVFGGFLMIPFLADFLVKNVGISAHDPLLVLGPVRLGGLEVMYASGGLATLFTMTYVGRLSDRYPRLLLFRIIGGLALVVIYLLARLPYGTPLALVLLVTTLMMVFMSGRMVPLTAIVTGIAPPQERGAFMSLLSSLQQLGAALGPVAAGWLMSDTAADQPLSGYENAALASVVVGAACVALAGVLKPPAAQPIVSSTSADDSTPPSVTGHAPARISNAFESRSPSR